MNIIDISIGIAMVLTAVAVPFFMIVAARPRTSDKFTFRYSKSFFYLGLFGDVLFVAVLIFAIYPYITEQKEFEAKQFWFGVIACSIFVFVGIVLMLYHLVWKIELREEYLYYRNLLGFVRKIPYNEIYLVVEELNKNGNSLNAYNVYYGRKKRICVDFLVMGAYDFLNSLKKRAREQKCKIKVEKKYIGPEKKKKK